MKAFTELFIALDETNKTSDKVAAMQRYFAAAPSADAAWGLYFLLGHKPRQVVPTRRLAEWAAEAAQTPGWLFEECYHAVGDLAETMALVLPDECREGGEIAVNRHPLLGTMPLLADSSPVASLSASAPLAVWVEHFLLPLREPPENAQRAAVQAAWRILDRRQRFVWNKLITGSFRVGVSAQLVIRAVARVANQPAAVMAHRLMGVWHPTPQFFEQLLAGDGRDADLSRPYPFFLAHPLEGLPADLGEIGQWLAEWKWDGIRAQLVRRSGQTFLWSRGEELVTDRYPELAAAAARLPDSIVLDGEILPWAGAVLPFAHLQRRIGRKSLTRKLLAEVPVVLMAFDLLEHQGADIRHLPLRQRRTRLEQVLATTADPHLMASPIVTAGSWEALAHEWHTSRGRNVEGLMLKRKESTYRVGRQRGDWWKWKVDPHTIDAVLIYAQRGSGKRASLYTDYTFGVWRAGELVPVAKAYSGLTDEEIREVDAFIRQQTVEKFGPVRTVRPELVFELGFEAIARSSRHKSGVAVRFPRILRWRRDKKPEEADTLDSLLRMLPAR